MTEKQNFDKLCAEIDMGRHDGNLGDLFNAIRKRLGEHMVGMPWRIEIKPAKGKAVRFGADDLSLKAMALAEELGARSWKTLDPEHSAVEYKAIVVAHLVEDRGWTELQVMDTVGAMTMDDLVASISFGEVWPDPKGMSVAS